MKKFKIRNGFTLAEMLIVVAVIGVVAILTVPALIANLQEKSWATSSDVFLKRFESSLRVMNTQGVLAGYRTTEDFVNVLSKHMKISKICSNDNLSECFNEYIYSGDENNKTETNIADLKTSRSFALDNWGTNTLGIQFANGVTGLLAYNPSCNANAYDNQSDVLKCVALIYDTSGFDKPNFITKDVNITGNVDVESFGCVSKLGGLCITKTAFKPTPVSKAECIEMAQSGKYDGMYENECVADNDYWAGAIKTCKGKIPTGEQAKTLVRSLYDCGNDCTFNWTGGGGHNYANLNESAYKQISTITPPISFWVLEVTSSPSWRKYYGIYKTYYDITHATSSGNCYAICVKD